ncbi:MAG: glycosyltransferase family 4 protein [Rikenellaceae bacterium]
MKKVVIAHPTGNANVRGAIYGLQRLGALHSYHTSVSCFKGGFTYLLSMLPPFKDFRKRMLSPLVKGLTYSYPFMELGRMVASKLKIQGWIAHESGKFCIDRVYSEMDRKVANFVERRSEEFDAVYCYEDCAEEIFLSAKALGKGRIYDLPIGYWRTMRKLLESERVNRPEWAVTLGGFNDSDEKLQRKDRELALAQKIYVASSFTKQSLLDYPGNLADIEVIPYGFPPVNETRQFVPIAERKIKLLFVGGLSQRKGIANIFETIEGLEDRVELTVVGAGNIDGCDALRSALSRVRYIPPIPHSEVLELMATQDVFLFPSLFEGFGLVITEAMSQGTPVITTDRTCGPDVITHGRDGWIVEAGSSEALRAQILELIDNPERIVEVGREALRRAKQRPWSRYEAELAESVIKFNREFGCLER